MRHKQQAKAEIKQHSDIVFTHEEATKFKNKWPSPLFLELCMGSGRFLSELAQQEARSNFVGLEIKAERALKAAQKVRRYNLENVKIIRSNLDQIEEYFSKESLDGIYLNFPDPWPKNKHVKNRSTTLERLKVYAKLLKPKGFLILKTDNKDFLDFTLRQLKETSFKIIKQAKIAAEDPENILTGYEIRWRSEGRELWRVKARR